MDFVRVLHIQHYDPQRRRFSSLAFKNSSGGGGISVFDAECAIGNSGGICPHIRKFYLGVAGAPPVYWRFSGRPLAGSGAAFDRVPSSTHDACHANIVNISDKQARRFLMAEARLERLRACLAEDSPVEGALLARWRREADGQPPH